MSQNSSVLDKVGIRTLPYVEADLNYLVPTPEKPVNYTFDPPPGIPRNSASSIAHKVPIYNGRAIASDFSVDREGFALVDHPTAVQDFYDEDQVRRVYYAEAERLLKDLTGAFKVIIFDHLVRNAQRSQPGKNDIREPGKRVHNDFTAGSGYSRARLVLNQIGETDPEALLQQRFSIINVWRAIANPIQESPLAISNARSIASSDWVASDLVYRDRVGETYSIIYDPNHEWVYFPSMHRDEALLIKCFDSAEDGRARFSAHSAFDDPTSPADAHPRESIELRTLVFYPLES
jgi:hypothetical protein